MGVVNCIQDESKCMWIATVHVVEMHHSPAAVSRSLTIAQLTGARPSQPYTHQSRRLSSSSNHSHSVVDSNDTRPRHSRTVVQMLQDSLVQRAQSQDVAVSSSSSSSAGCSKVVRSQTSKLCVHIDSDVWATSCIRIMPGCCWPLMEHDTICHFMVRVFCCNQFLWK